MRGVEHQFAVLHDEAAVHEHGLHADRGLVGVLIGRTVRDSGRVKDDDGSVVTRQIAPVRFVPLTGKR